MPNIFAFGLLVQKKNIKLNLFALRILHANFKNNSGQLFMGRKYSKLFARNCTLYINLYKTMSPWGRAIYDHRNFICANLNLPVPRMLHNKYQCIWASDL